MNMPQYTGKNEIIELCIVKFISILIALKALSVAAQNKLFYSLRNLGDLFLDRSGSSLWDSPGLLFSSRETWRCREVLY